MYFSVAIQNQHAQGWAISIHASKYTIFRHKKTVQNVKGTVADWVLIIWLKNSHFFATAQILKACI